MQKDELPTKGILGNRVATSKGFSETGLEDATVSVRCHHTNGVVKGSLREEESGDGKPGQIQDA
jgi:hypothetical protein